MNEIALIDRGYLPFFIFLNNLNSMQGQNLWHKEIEIILVLKGKMGIALSDKVYSLEERDLFLVNSGESHTVTFLSDDSLIMSLYIDMSFYKKYYQKLSELYLDCKFDSTVVKNKKYEALLKYIAKLMSYNIEKEAYYEFELLKESLSIIEYLLIHFSVDYQSITSANRNRYNEERLIRFIDYIENHYTENIKLEDVAAIEYISIYYLSKLFKKYLGIGFHEYLNHYRLIKSIDDLLNTSKKITSIALDNGFPNVKSYINIFKKYYNITPEAYRKGIINTKHSTDYKPIYLSHESQNIISQFIKSQNLYLKDNTDETITIEVDSKRTEGKFRVFKKVLYFDFVYDGLNTNWQHNLKKIQHEIHFEYIRFSGIFTEGMYFYNKEENKYNWFFIDTLLDFFIQNKLKPFIELYFTSKKYTLKAWHILLKDFISHCIEKFGLDEVQNWKFELVSEDRSYEKAIDLYSKTIKIIQKNFKTLKLGILFIPAPDFEERNFLINFKDKNLDFMSVQIDHDILLQKKGLIKELLHNIKNMNLKTYLIKTAEYHFLNDSTIKASALVNEILNDFEDADRQVIFIDSLRSSKMFHGGLGILTYNGYKKSVYNAYHLLSQLKGDILSKGKRHIVLKEKNKFQILLYNFTEMDYYSKFAVEDYRNVIETLTDNSIKIQLSLSNLTQGKYKFKYQTLCRESGCIFDSWNKMSSPKILAREDLDYLSYKEQMDLEIKVANIDGVITINELLSNDTVKLIEIEKV